MFGAFADGEDGGIGGAHIVADHDAAVGVEPGRFGQGDVGADAHGHHHQIGGNLPAIGQDAPNGPGRRR